MKKFLTRNLVVAELYDGFNEDNNAKFIFERKFNMNGKIKYYKEVFTGIKFYDKSSVKDNYLFEYLKNIEEITKYYEVCDTRYVTARNLIDMYNEVNRVNINSKIKSR